MRRLQTGHEPAGASAVQNVRRNVAHRVKMRPVVKDGVGFGPRVRVHHQQRDVDVGIQLPTGLSRVENDSTSC